MSELQAEREWAGKLSGMAFILEFMLTEGYLHNGGKLAAQLGQREILRQWNNTPMTTPEGLSRLDVAHVHRAGDDQIASIFEAVIDRLGQVEEGPTG